MWSLQLYTDVCSLYPFRFTRPWRAAPAGVARAAHTVLQPRAVGERISLMWGPSRRQTLHPSVVVLCGLGLVLFNYTGEAAGVGRGAGEVMTFSDGRSSVLGSGEHLG